MRRRNSYFRRGDLIAAFDVSVASGSIRGLDRISPVAFGERKDEELRVAHKRLRNGTYRFTPYVENLRVRGRGRPPRLLSIPTVRDRVILIQLKKLLHDVFPERVGRTLPNAYIRSIRETLKASSSELVVHRSDISGFYDSLSHNVLEGELRRRIKSSKLMRLIFRALRTPTVPRGYRRTEKAVYLPTKGVPQGLAISNVLAGIYVRQLDEALAALPVEYHRYVDDIIIVGVEADVLAAVDVLSDVTGRLGLSVNPTKSYSRQVNDGFEFLGYSFKGGIVSVREKTVDRFLDKLAARFTFFREVSSKRDPHRPWLGPLELRQIFVDEMNETITGAIAEDRRYGWLFYFLEMDDKPLLHQLDRVVTELYSRTPSFGAVPADGKRFVRTYYEAQFRTDAGYIQNYNNFNTLALRHSYLQRIGLLNPDVKYSAADITHLFETEKARRLRFLEQDVGTFS